MNFFARLQSGRPQTETGSDYCKLEKGLDRQSKCKGCKQVEILFEFVDEQERRKQFSPPSRPILLHPNYKDLDFCARKCMTCRVFRQALLLEHATTNSTEGFDQIMKDQPVSVVLNGSVNTTLEVRLGPLKAHTNAAKVSCDGQKPVKYLALPEDSTNPLVHKQVLEWLVDCIDHHTLCGNVGWSSLNPTRLVRILSDTELQLVDWLDEDEKIRYTALSYCWGPQEEDTNRSRTTKDNFEERRHCFSISDLPATIRDAIILTRALDIQYIWVDSICIIQKDPNDWHHEAGRMHEVYGNAQLTLCVSSNDSAIKPLFKKREAWSYATTPCKLGNQWLSNSDMPLDKMRAISPLATRGWTLQEERLSPRILYWSSQSMYWSCSKYQQTEAGSSTNSASISNLKPKFEEHQIEKAPAAPQSFLLSCRNGQSTSLHDSWLDLVESYTQRNLTRKEDRFPALSGLASKYYVAQNDDYLAGLWRKHLGEGLGWCVINPRVIQKSDSLRSWLASWTWASLPLGTGTKLKHAFSPASHFSFVQARNCSVMDVLVNTETTDSPESSLNGLHRPADPITRGASINQLIIRARIRPFCYPSSTYTSWSLIISSSSSTPYTDEYNFSANPSQAVHSIDIVHARLLVYEDRKQEVLGRLDYLQDAEVLYESGVLVDVQCIEVGNGTMILAESVEHTVDIEEKWYRRIGVAHGYRDDFFEETEVAQIVLV